MGNIHGLVSWQAFYEVKSFTVASFSIHSSGAPNDAKPISCKKKELECLGTIYFVFLLILVTFWH